LTEGVFEGDASLMFNNLAQKVIKDAIKHVRYQSITYYYSSELKKPMNTKIARLTPGEGEVPSG
jgi:hypothetical protein